MYFEYEEVQILLGNASRIVLFFVNIDEANHEEKERGQSVICRQDPCFHSKCHVLRMRLRVVTPVWVAAQAIDPMWLEAERCLCGDWQIRACSQQARLG